MKIENTPGYKVAITFKPFIDPKCTEHMEIVKDMGKSINSTYRPIVDWVLKGEFVYMGLTYRKGINDSSANDLLKTLYQ